MKRLALTLSLTLVATLATLVTSATPAYATIHPLVVSFICGKTDADPPGQTPGANHSDQSTLRALQATGILTFTSSGPVIDLTKPASKFSSFDPATETGTPTNPGALNCRASQ